MPSSRDAPQVEVRKGGALRLRFSPCHGRAHRRASEDTDWRKGMPFDSLSTDLRSVNARSGHHSTEVIGLPSVRLRLTVEHDWCFEWPAMSEPSAHRQVSRMASRMVRKRGLEPPRYCYRQPLKLVRLPIPPLPRSGLDLTAASYCLTAAASWEPREQAMRSPEQPAPALGPGRQCRRRPSSVLECPKP